MTKHQRAVVFEALDKALHCWTVRPSGVVNADEYLAAAQPVLDLIDRLNKTIEQAIYVGSLNLTEISVGNGPEMAVVNEMGGGSYSTEDHLLMEWMRVHDAERETV